MTTAKKQRQPFSGVTCAEYRDLVEGAGDLIQSVDREGRFIYVNRKWQSVLGYTAAEAKAMTFARVIRPDQLPHCMEIFGALKQGRAATEINTVFVSKDGRSIAVEGNISTRTHRGVFISTRGIFRDISERVLTEERLLQERKELDRIAKMLVRRDFDLLQTNEALRLLDETRAKDEAMLASIGEGVVVVDPKERILLINDAAQTMAQKNRQDAFDQNWFEVIRMEDEDGNLVPPDRQPLHRALSEGKKVSDRTHYFRRKDTTRIPVAMTASPVILQEKIIGAVMVCRDSTEEWQIDRAKSEFVSVASHQLRTPLTALKWTLNLLMADPGLGEKQKERIQILYSTNEKFIALVNNLLAACRADAGKLVARREHVTLAALIAQTVSLLEHTAAERRQQITVIAPAETDVYIDPFLFHEAFKNLLSNAISYAAEESTITVTVRRQDAFYELSIHNVGSFIPEEERANLFKKFYRGETAHAVRSEGSGLGLFIARSVVELNGGKLWFDSQRDTGTTFFFTVPAATHT